MRSNKTFTRQTSGFLAFLFVLMPVAGSSSIEREWRFRVYLDEREIGHHHFSLIREGQEERLATEAKFDVTFLKIPFFTYRHDNIERWSGSCLQQIDSSTNQNGTEYRPPRPR